VLGAKILVAGGGRCNVTHHAVDETAYAGSSRNAVRKVLGRFDVARTVEFFESLGVTLKREETGKLFPTTDDAHTVLDALLRALGEARAEVAHPWRAGRVERAKDGAFVLTRAEGGDQIRARRVVLATGGKSLPKTGSDGHGYAIARSLGHSITPRVFPALVPLTLPKDHWICGLSGLTVAATLEVRAGTGKRLVSFTNSTLCTHFGLSGPSVLDISRYFTDSRFSDPGAVLVMNWLPGESPGTLDAALRVLGRVTPVRFLSERLPERLVRALCEAAGVEASAPGHALTRDARRALVTAVAECPLPVTGDRGFTYAEVTAGGVPLSEVRLETMESRVCPGLYLCGEILDVDGRIGGFNFQWAWASGFVAGCGAAGA
jgi:predicted Rossmann fold flavoprotein